MMMINTLGEEIRVGTTVQHYTHLEFGIAVRLENGARWSELSTGASTGWSLVILIRLHGLMFRFSHLSLCSIGGLLD